MSLDRAALEELARRTLRREGAAGIVASLKKELFDKQIAVWEAMAENTAVICPRRAGKTSLWARLTVGEAILHDAALIRIWHASRLRAKQLVWSELKLVCKRHKLKVTFNDTELTATFENRSEIRLVGADKDKEAQKKRGDKIWIDVVLESQNFGNLLEGIVFDVIEPCLMDERQRGGGRLYLEGSPGPTCGGLWYDITGRYDGLEGQWDSIGGIDENGDPRGAGWKCFRWQSTSNPFMPHMREELEKLRKKRRWTEDNPTYIREYTGLWVNDFDALFYKFQEGRNTYNTEAIQPWGPGWHHVLGWDLGSRDDMALVVLGYHDNMPDLYEAFSWKKPGALSAEVMEQIDELTARGFNIEAMVADTQGGGKMYVEDVQARYGKSFKPAAKGSKFEHVQLFNDDLLTGHIKMRPGSPLASELANLPRDPDWDPNSGKPPTEAASFPNHCADACLYAFREARHYWHTPKEVKATKGSPAAVDAWLKEVETKLAERKQKEDWLEREATSWEQFHDDW